MGSVVRSERDKWQVPESDPAGKVPQPERGTGSMNLPAAGSGAEPVHSAERAPLIYCGQCGALNPATNHYCAACGATLVDAFHATEGLRVYDRPDTASRMIEIIPAGSELDLVDDPDAPADFLRVKLQYGRLGYIRVADIDALTGARQNVGGSTTHLPAKLVALKCAGTHLAAKRIAPGRSTMFPAPKVVPKRLARAYARGHPTPTGRTCTAGWHTAGNTGANGAITCSPLGEGRGVA